MVRRRPELSGSGEAGGDVADLADEPADAGARARVEAAVLVERGGRVVNGVHGEIAPADPVAGSHCPAQGVEKQFRPQALAVKPPVKSEPGQQERRNAVGISPAEPAK